MKKAELRSQVAELERQVIATKSVPVITEFMEEYKETANKAASVLGYQPLAAVTSAPLKRILHELSIEIFDTSLVEEYKRKLAALKDAEAGFWDNNSWWWSERGIASYTDPIPAFVLNKAIQIKEKLPAAHFYVHSLIRGQSHDPDPFLSVAFFGEKYYVEVWDEPEFEGKRKKN